MCALFLWKSLTILPTFHSSQLSPGAKAWEWWVARRSRRWSHILSWDLTASYLSLSFKFSIYFHNLSLSFKFSIFISPYLSSFLFIFISIISLPTYALHNMLYSFFSSANMIPCQALILSCSETHDHCSVDSN